MVEVITTIQEADELLKRLKSDRSNFKKVNLLEVDYFASISYNRY